MKLIPILKELGARRVIELKTSGAFHTSLMNEASQKLGKEIQNSIQSEYWQVKPQANFLPLSQLVSIAEASTGHSVKRVQLAPKKDKAWQFQLNGGQQLSINPFNGDILHRYLEEESFYGFVMAWHRWLLWRDDSNEKPLKIVVSIISLLLIIEMLIGLTLWLKPKNRLKRLKINIKASKPVLVATQYDVPQ